jgi:hypothetical protein
MNIPKVATAGQFALCEVEWRAGSARSPNCAVTPHNESLHIKLEIGGAENPAGIATGGDGAVHRLPLALELRGGVLQSGAGE